MLPAREVPIPEAVHHQLLDLPMSSGGYVFNPALMRTPAGLICLYRHVGQDRRRAIVRCRLDESLRVVGEVAVWSEEVRALGGGVAWYADPRTFRWNGRYFVNFNTGDTERPNNIYLVEVDEDARPLSPPIKVEKTDGRRDIEKNWGFFEYGGELYAVYSLSPFTILHCRMDGDTLKAAGYAAHHWQSEALELAFGPLHGGASPVRVGDTWHLVTQSRIQGPRGFVYAGSVLSFEARPPFRPVAVAPEPAFQLSEDEYRLRAAEPLNDRVDACLYPCGAALSEDGQYLDIAYGINDFRAALRRYPMDMVAKAQRPIIRRTPALTGAAGNEGESQAQPTIRTFFWQPELSVYRTLTDLSRGVFRFGNAGDALQGAIVARLFGARSINTQARGRRLLGAGSVAHRMLAGDILWGCGFKERPPEIGSAEAATVKALAVRGPLTRDYLRRYGVDVSGLEMFFDPGLLIGDLFAAEIATLRSQADAPSGVLYLPHYSDAPRFAQMYGGRRGSRVGTMDCDLFELCRLIMEAELVVSSSLHGVIFAEALGVSAILHRPPEQEEPTKYQDYYLGTGRNAFPLMEEGGNPAHIRPPPLPVIPPNWRQTLPSLADMRSAGVLLDVAVREGHSGPWGEGVGQPDQAGFRECVVDISRYYCDRFQLQVAVRLRAPTTCEVVCRDVVILSGELPAADHFEFSVELDGTPLEALGEGIVRIVLVPHDPDAVVQVLSVRGVRLPQR